MKNKMMQLIQLNSNKTRAYFQVTAFICLIATGVLIRNITSSKALTDASSLLKNQTVENLLFSNASLENNKFKVAVQNTQESSYTLKTITVSFLDVDNNIITSINGYIGNILTADNSKQLVVETDEDLSSAVNIQYTINK